MTTNLPLRMGASIISDRKLPVVNSYNEWDTLQEVIVGRVEGSVIPQFEANVKVDSPPRYWNFFQQYGGQPFPEDLVETASKELNEFCKILEAEGVTVRRPDIIGFSNS
jgi:glycine amidinotransferase